MNLNAGKAYRARLGFASLLGTVVVVVAGKAALGGGGQPSAPAMPGGGASPAAVPAAVDSPSATATATATAAASATATGSPTAAPTRSSTTSTARRTVVGTTENTRYGPVQVELVLTSTKIVDVVTLQIPNAQQRDAEINSQAVPILRQEVLAAQDAKIDSVSGASYTSSGYAYSVQSALDKVGITR
jgi:uncharacterized protein with FMN-binding domain